MSSVVRWLGRLGLWLLLTAASLSLLAWLTLHWGILPRLDEWRPRLAAAVSQQLGVTVEIGRLQARSSGWVPAFTLYDVVLRDEQGREALRLPQVAAALSVPSLLAFKPRLAQLLIDDASLEVRRDRQGRWWVAGLDLSGGGADTATEGPPAWLFEMGEFVIRGGQLRWTDEARGAPALALQKVQLVLRNRGLRHELRLDATPPVDWGDAFQIMVTARQPLLTREGLVAAGDWRKWSGTLFAHLPRVDVASLRQHVDLPVDVQSGRAALRAWLDWDRLQPNGLTLDAQFEDVRLRLAPQLEPLDLTSAGLRLDASRQDDGVKVALSQLAFETTWGQRWEPSSMDLQWRWAGGGPSRPTPGAASAALAQASAPAVYWSVAGGQFQADRLDLAPMAALAERLPLGQSLRTLLAQIKPEGRLQTVRAQWQGPLDAPRSFTVSALARGLALASAPSPEHDGIGRPGLRGADLDFKATERGGDGTVRMTDGSMSFPGVLEVQEVALKQFSAQVKWQIEPKASAAPKVVVQVKQAQFANDDLQGSVQGSWRTGAGTGFGQGGRLPGILSLDGQISRGQANRMALYLPMGVPAHIRHWVRRAVQSGEVNDMSVKVQGDMWAFPYVNRQEGEFRLSAKVRDLGFAPLPSVPPGEKEPAWQSPWPAYQQVQGQLFFERNSLRFEQVSGRLWDSSLSQVKGRIRELSPHALLEVEGLIQGPAADFLRFVRSTPINEWTGESMAKATATGPAEMRLALNVPLAHAGETVVRADLQLTGNDVRWRPDLPLLAQARGPVEITHRGMQLRGVRTQVLGGEALVEGGTTPEGALRFQASGVASAEGLRRTVELPPLAHWAQYLRGQAAYKAQLAFVQGMPELQVSSSLQGMAVELPAPLAKAAETAQPLRVQTRLLPPATAAALPTRDEVQLRLGPLQLAWLRDISTAEPVVLRSSMAFGSRLPEPVAGGYAVLSLPRLDVDQWRGFFETGAKPGQAKANPADGAAGAGGLAWPDSIQLATQELVVLGRRLSGLTLGLQRMQGAGEAGWRAQLVSDQAQGTVEFQDGHATEPAGRVRARLSRLTLPRAEAEQVSSLLDDAPGDMPALDIQVAQFDLNGRPLGRLAVDAQNRPLAAGQAARGASGGRSEWRLNRLQLENPDALFVAQGFWQAPTRVGAQRRVALDFSLDILDGGKLLERLAFGSLIQGGRGELRGKLHWDGSPLALHIPSLGGAFRLQMTQGKFLKADAGAARLLGVLSLQALPRRLLLDFRDVFQEGFNFDDLQGDLSMAAGVLSTRHLRMRGLQAAVLMEGSADIAHETQDLHAVVLPELNTASASLAYAAINPAIGLGALLGQWLLREPLRQASAREFRITGSWDDPQVTRVERKLSDPLPTRAEVDAPLPPWPASAPAMGLPLPTASQPAASVPR